jgi:hypothetical protein
MIAARMGAKRVVASLERRCEELAQNGVDLPASPRPPAAAAAPLSSVRRRPGAVFTFDHDEPAPHLPTATAAARRVVAAVVHEGGLEMHWDDGSGSGNVATTRLAPGLLRASCACTACRHGLTSLLRVSGAATPAASMSAAVHLGSAAVVGDAVSLRWEDGHHSVFPAVWLLEHSGYGGGGGGGGYATPRSRVLAPPPSSAALACHAATAAQ